MMGHNAVKLCNLSFCAQSTLNLNLRIGAGGRIKVSDFGMAVERGSEGNYRVASGKREKVPVKWMAPESIEDHIYTHKTDVVSNFIHVFFLCDYASRAGALTILGEA